MPQSATINRGLFVHRETTMRAFFHGWRRKAGCVALVGACAVAMAWIRTWQDASWIWLSPNHSSSYTLQSHNRLITGRYLYYPRGPMLSRRHNQFIGYG